jgi:hypothetical protein
MRGPREAQGAARSGLSLNFRELTDMGTDENGERLAVLETELKNVKEEIARETKARKESDDARSRREWTIIAAIVTVIFGIIAKRLGL